MKKNTLFGMPILIVGIILAFGFAACEPAPEEDKTLSAGTYIGTPTGARTPTTTSNTTLDNAAAALDSMTAPKFEIMADGTMRPMFGSGNNAFLIFVVEQNPTLFRFDLGSDNTLTLQIKPSGGSWQDWNTHNVNATGATVVKSLSGSFNPSTGKVTLVFKYTANSDSSSRTYEFTKQ